MVINGSINYLGEGGVISVGFSAAGDPSSTAKIIAVSACSIY